MAVKIPPNIIIALIVVFLMIIVIFGFFAQALFGGPEVTAAKTIADQVNLACDERAGFKTNFNVFLPDSKGVPPDREFFYMAIDKNYLLLLSREEKGSLGAQFADFASCACKKTLKTLSQAFFCSCNEGIDDIRKIELKNCENDNIIVCGKTQTSERCGKFQFEAEEGKESLTFNLERKQEPNGDEKLLLIYSRA